eukprot:3530663-Prorocentrum_lima.AAC.1
MTSSLVGSEMCIRDSKNAVSKQSTTLIPGTLQGSTSRIFDVSLGGRPVSYTHLTLPTICSV